MAHTVTLIPGDGIGPEVAQCTRRIVAAAGVDIDWDTQPAGAEVAETDGTAIPQRVVDSIREHRVALKGPVGTPIGRGFRSVNVTLRQDLGLFACLRPVKSVPGISTRYENVDLVIVRENTEGEYSGLEHMVVKGVAESLKVITEMASMRVCEFAFRTAAALGRKHVTAVHKANIMKVTDGLFLQCARQVASKHKELPLKEMIVDNCAMQLVSNPQQFEVMVMTNLYGDILSDLCAGMVGGLGVVPSANIGDDCAIYEAVHGSAPDIAGQGVANPTALTLSAAMMLERLGEKAAGQRIQASIFKVFEENKIRTRDLGGTATSAEFTDEICRQVESSE